VQFADGIIREERDEIVLNLQGESEFRIRDGRVGEETGVLGRLPGEE
jgi:hypothetical protein